MPDARRAGRPRLHRRALMLALVSAALLSGVRPAPQAHAAATLAFPAPEGTAWAVLSGYNTVTHSVADKNDPYALDLERTDAVTDGTVVLAPIAGTISYVSSSCLTIRDASRVGLLICHLFPLEALRGRTVARGERIGVVAPPGQAGNNGVAHLHLALTAATGGPLPFVDAYAIEGIAFPATTEGNAYAGTAVRSTNRALPSVDAGADVTVRPGTPVTLRPTVLNVTGASLAVAWTQVSGTPVTLSSAGETATFTAPARTGTLEFRVAVSDGTPDVVSDTVTVRVSTTVPTPSPPTVTAASATGRFTSPPVFSASGQALAAFSGGSVAQLEAAAASVQATGVWVQEPSGAYRLLVVNGPAFLRSAFVERFPAGFPGVIAVTVVR